MIRVYLYGRLRERARATDESGLSYVEVEYSNGQVIEDILSLLGIAPKDISHVFLNHQYSALSRPLRDGDRLAFFPADMGLLYRQYFPVHKERV